MKPKHWQAQCPICKDVHSQTKMAHTAADLEREVLKVKSGKVQALCGSCHVLYYRPDEITD